MTDAYDDDHGNAERPLRGLGDMPIEVVQMITRHLDTPHDLGAFAIAAPHLVADPVTPQVAKMIGFARASDVLVRGAPLSAVIALFAKWDEPVAVHMLGDAAEGGRLDVVQWIYDCIADGLRDVKDCDAPPRGSKSTFTTMFRATVVPVRARAR
ncbi:hypothetical protein TW95_gp0618 [Pandoravirus inopinatum]|uniref:Uncharacterized protein n=1 Tax=Pandoravirus inopinatum TaxID=1605721 RepID=A0A0B5JCJ2_9VIRU|nr:hypothetical protein TW95_gp0618 [Pandoravirus inopinatum]AJF97352.1 hypothetical protein [Pandoravirus inopinatum]